MQHTKFDGGLSNLPPASGVGATDWFKKFLERKRGHLNGVAAAADKTTRTYFPFRVDIWTDDGGSVLEHLAGIENLIVARGAYRAACERWPHAAITLRKGAMQQMRIPEGEISGHRGLGPKSLRSFSADKRLLANGRHLQLAQTLPNLCEPPEHLQSTKAPQRRRCPSGRLGARAALNSHQ